MVLELMAINLADSWTENRRAKFQLFVSTGYACVRELIGSADLKTLTDWAINYRSCNPNALELSIHENKDNGTYTTITEKMWS